MDQALRIRFLFQTTPMAESANELLDQLSEVMEAEAFASAVAHGESKSLDVMVKELLAESRTHPPATV